MAIRSNKPLTAAQQKTYDYIVSFALERGYLPTVRQICDGTGYSSTSTIFNHMEQLNDKGYISHTHQQYGYSVKGLTYIYEGAK